MCPLANVLPWQNERCNSPRISEPLARGFGVRHTTYHIEARSEDSLATWNLVAGELRSLVGEAEFDYPVFRSISSRRLPVESITLEAMSAGRPQVVRILGGTPIQWQIDGRNIGSEDLLTQELEALIEELGAVPIKVIVSPGATYEQVSTTVDLISRSGFLEIRPSRGR